jgi:hypothetical protein
MKININTNPDQIRHYARSALLAFEFHTPVEAQKQVVADMNALLRYLDACDHGNGVVIVGIAEIERGVRLEISRRKNQIVDLTDGYAESAADISDATSES